MIFSLDWDCTIAGLSALCLPILLLDFWREDCRRLPCRLFEILRVPLSICVQQASSRQKTVPCLQKGSMVCRDTLDCYINNLKQIYRESPQGRYSSAGKGLNKDIVGFVRVGAERMTVIVVSYPRIAYIQIIQIAEKMSSFQNNSLLGSSTGFKKRNLLRPASGMLNKRLEFLRAVDISQSEPAIASLIRSEVANIEQQINVLDKDRRIRQNEGGLQKGYVTALRKWLQGGQALTDKEDDEVKILKQLGADSYQSGFKKLWKVACNLDLMITKITELQIVHFLLYDDMFAEVGSDSQRTSTVLNSISNNGYISGTFQITQVLLDRSKDVYAATKKGGNVVRGKEEIKGRDETSELITQLKGENAKLTSLLEKLSEEREQERLRQSKESSIAQKKESSFVTSTDVPHNPKQAFAEIQEKYKEQIIYLSSEKARSDAAVVDLKVKISSLESQLKANALSFKIPTGSVPKSGSYQEALMQQMQKMKRGFEKKISMLTDDFAGRERQLRKKEADYKSENEKIKWEKGLLLKKFQLIPQK